MRILISALIVLMLCSALATSVHAVDTLPILRVERTLPQSQTRQSAEPRVILVLSGGGARGAAHVGVLRELERAGIRPSMVIGTSMGAIIGGLWCAGYTARELDSLLQTVDWDKQFATGIDRDRNRLFLDQKYEQDRAVLTLRFHDFLLVVPQSVTNVMRFSIPFLRLFWNAPYHDNGNFDNLKIPFRAVATDIAHARVVALGAGNLVESIRASATLPLRYSPVHMDSMVLVDGGLLANIPVEIAQAYKPDMIIAVNTTSPLLPTTALDKPWNVADQIVSVMEKQFNERATGQATVLIQPRISDHPNTEFNELDTLVRAGEIAARQMLPEIRSRINSLRDSLSAATGMSSIEQRSQTAGARRIQHLAIDVSDTTLAQKLQVLIGSEWNEESIRERILRLCRKSRRAFAEIRVLRFDTATSTLELRIDEGRLRSLEINGNTTATRLFVARELNLSVGDRLSADDILSGLESIMSTDLFSEASIDLQRNAREGVDVTLNVVERGSQILRIGGRIDNERNTQVQADFVQENVFATGVRLGLRVGGGGRNSVVDGRIDIPRILDSYWLFSLRGYWDSRNIYLYSYVYNSFDRYKALQTGDAQQQHLGVRALFGRQVETSGRITVEARYEAQRMFQLGDFVSNREFKPLGALALSVLIDGQDRADFPTRGRVLQLRVERSILQAPDVPQFTKAEVLSSRTFQFGDQAVKPSLRLAFSDVGTPQTEWFHLGGQDAFFGMREDERRSRNLLLANLEYRVKLPLRLLLDSYFSVRYDIGGIWPSVDAIRLEDLHQGLGAQLSLDTPLGPARVSVGRSFYFHRNPNAVVLGPYQVYFSVGMRIQ
ncbi:MAG: patatin-like phospholipase family protein [Candidatus Kapaibacterium sp.]